MGVLLRVAFLPSVSGILAAKIYIVYEKVPGTKSGTGVLTFGMALPMAAWNNI